MNFMTKSKAIETKEQTALREAIEIIERKRFLGFTKSEKSKLDYAAARLRRFLPNPVAIEGGIVYCPCCNEILPFSVNDSFTNIYCQECGQCIYHIVGG